MSPTALLLREPARAESARTLGRVEEVRRIAGKIPRVSLDSDEERRLRAVLRSP